MRKTTCHLVKAHCSVHRHACPHTFTLCPPDVGPSSHELVCLLSHLPPLLPPLLGTSLKWLVPHTCPRPQAWSWCLGGPFPSPFPAQYKAVSGPGTQLCSASVWIWLCSPQGRLPCAVPATPEVTSISYTFTRRAELDPAPCLGIETPVHPASSVCHNWDIFLGGRQRMSHAACCLHPRHCVRLQGCSHAFSLKYTGFRDKPCLLGELSDHPRPSRPLDEFQVAGQAGPLRDPSLLAVTLAFCFLWRPSDLLTFIS